MATNPFVLFQETIATQQTVCTTLMDTLLPLAAGANKAMTTHTNTWMHQWFLKNIIKKKKHTQKEVRNMYQSRLSLQST